MAQYNNRNRRPTNGLFSALSILFAGTVVLGVLGGLCWWLYTTVTTVMAGFDHLIAVTFSGPHLHWILLLVLTVLLAAITRGLGYALFGFWAAVWVCGFAWWQGLLLFAPALFILLFVFIAPAILFGIAKLFLELISVLGGRR